MARPGLGSARRHSFLIGLYAGRDLAILAHYKPLITLAVWGLTSICLVGPRTLAIWTVSLNLACPWAGWAVTGFLVAAFGVNAWWWCRRESSR